MNKTRTCIDDLRTGEIYPQYHPGHTTGSEQGLKIIVIYSLARLKYNFNILIG